MTERTVLYDEVQALKAAKDELTAHKARLAAEVASLETARRMRHEELATMEARAEGLERRVLEGIIDHSRALLISRPVKDPKNMSLKRVSMGRPGTKLQQGSTQSPAPASPSLSTIPHNTVTLALKSRPPPIRMNAGSGAVGSNAATHSPGGRRILSLNQITGNVPKGGHALARTGGGGAGAPHDLLFSASRSGANSASGFGGLGNLKRSHSVKTGSGTGYLRKSSAGPSLLSKGTGRVSEVSSLASSEAASALSVVESSVDEDKENYSRTGSTLGEDDDASSVTETAYFSDRDDSALNTRSRTSLASAGTGSRLSTARSASNTSTAMLSAASSIAEEGWRCRGW